MILATTRPATAGRRAWPRHPFVILVLLATSALLAGILAAASPAGAAAPSGKLIWTYTQASLGFNSDGITAAVPGPNGTMFAASTMDDDWGPGSSDLGMYRLRQTMAASGPVLWHEIWDNPSDHMADWPGCMATDAAGNAIAAGGTYAAGRGVDWLIVKRAPNGSLLWTATCDGTDHDNDYLEDVACDRAGNVYACGRLHVGPGKSDWVVNKYRGSDGQLLWSYVYKGPVVPQMDNGANGLTVDSTGSAYVTGESENAGGQADIVVMRLSPSGAVMWTDRIDGAAGGRDRGEDIALRGGAVYVAGGAQTAATGTDVMMARYTTAGVRRWTRTWRARQDSSSTSVNDLTLDGAGDPVVCGGTNVGSGEWVAYVVSWTPAGKQRWAVTWWDPKLAVKNARFASVVADGAGTVWAGGSVDKSDTDSDALLVRLKSSGAVKWVRRLDGDDHSDDWFEVIALWGKSSLFAGGAMATTTGGADALAARYVR